LLQHGIYQSGYFEHRGHRHASRYLELLSSFAPGAPIPVAVFESVRMKTLFGRRWAGFRSELKALAGQSLVSVGEIDSPESATVAVHPIVAEVYWSRAYHRCLTPKFRTGRLGLVNYGGFAGTIAAGLMVDINSDDEFDLRLVPYLTPHFNELLAQGRQ
jgi:hypothetical protein